MSTSIESLVFDLASPNRIVRSKAIYSLNEIGVSARPAIPALKRVMNDGSEPFLQIIAAGAVGAIARDDPGAVPILVAALNDPIGLHRATACELLGERRHRSGVLSTMKLLNDEDFSVRFAAAEAIGLTFGNWLHAVGMCVAMLKDADSSIRAMGSESILSIKKFVQNDLDVLEMALVDASSNVRLEIEEVLAQLRSE
ncbi:MAG: HEAT repeat domain-containing protein [Planctomycetaceae bacterium]